MPWTVEFHDELATEFDGFTEGSRTNYWRRQLTNHLRRRHPGKFRREQIESVSYTHLDVYKRQLDLSVPGAHGVIGDRALAEDPAMVARLGRAFAEGLLAAGIQPIGKHAPGHGRARVDSHLSLPTVEANHLDADLLPFARNADLPWMMTAHIVYPAFDPALPATLSPTIIDQIIRRRIGFQGVLVTDDLAMKALGGGAVPGEPADLAIQALAAGCDLALYCSGAYDPTEALLSRCPPLSDQASQRLTRSRAKAARARLDLDAEALARERDRSS